MGRTMPTECDDCGGVLDWGDFGPTPDDGLDETTCTCKPKTAWGHLPEPVREAILAEVDRNGQVSTAFIIAALEGHASAQLDRVGAVGEDNSTDPQHSSAPDAPTIT